MDKKVQDFLNKFHQILGIDSKEAQDQAVVQYEQATMQRVMAAFMNGLTDDQRKKYEDFIKQKPEPNSEQQTKFLGEICPGGDMLALIERETAKLAQEYATHMLQFANQDQKDKIKALAREYAGM